MTDGVVQHTRGSRWRRVRLVGLLGILALLVAHTGLDFWAGRRVDAGVARLEKRFGSLSEATLVLSPVPAADNRARIVKAAAALVDQVSTPVQTAVYRFINRSASSPIPADVRAFAEANRSAVHLADEVRTRRQSNWEADPRNPGSQPPLMEIRALGNALCVTALLELEAGRPEDASRVITTGLAVGASIRQEPSLIAQLVRIAIALQQFETVEQLIVRSDPSKAALEDVARWLVENREPDPMGLGLVAELKLANSTFATIELGGVTNLGGVATDRPMWFRPVARMVGRPFSRMARVRYLEQMERLIDAQAGSRPRPTGPVISPAPFWNLPARLEGSFTSGLERAVETGDLFSSALGATEIGVALRRFRLDRGTYPDELSALTPVYLTRVPIDPFTGKPPVYARNGQGFTLKAQGGNDYRLVKSALDWVVEK